MGKLGNSITRHVVTRNDYDIVAPDQPVFVKAGKKIAYNVAPGQLVAYVVENGTTRTVDAATLTAADLGKLNIGVGHDASGNGNTDSIRHFGIDHINGCNLEKTSTASPSCGAPEVWDFYFDCTKCDETYTVMVTVDDNRSRSFAPFMKSGIQFTGTVVTECHTCDDCPVEHNCKEIACKLADALNGDCDLKIGDEAYPDWKNSSGVERPFKATRLHDRSIVYCIAPEGTDCEDCNHYPAIGPTATVLGETVDLLGATNPADPTQTLFGQIDTIVCQIQGKFDEIGGHQGSIYVTSNNQSDCCPIQIHVNTCDAGFAIDGLTPTVDENPFEEYANRTKPSDCIDCGEEPVEQKFNCGIRIIAAPLESGCECLITQPLNFYGRKIKIQPIGDGWTHGYWLVKKIQDLQLPSGFGSWVQWLELKQTTGGDGRNYRRSSYQKGWLNQFDATSRVVAAPTADCKKDYCSFYLKTSHDKKTVCNEIGRIDIHSTIHIPTGDQTTIDAWYPLLEKLIELSPQCIPLTAVECNTDKDYCDPATILPGDADGEKKESK